MKKQREIIYKERRKVLEGQNIKEEISEMIKKQIQKVIDKTISDNSTADEWNFDNINHNLSMLLRFPINIEPDNNLEKSELFDKVLELANEKYLEKENTIGEVNMRELERVILLQVVDSKWMDHIDAMDQLKQGIGLRAIGQDNPVRAYQIEGFDMFDQMIDSIQEDTVSYLLGFEIKKEENLVRRAVVDMDELQEHSSEDLEEEQKPKQVINKKNIGRNDSCPCGSGKKYKNCCGR